MVKDSESPAARPELVQVTVPEDSVQAALALTKEVPPGRASEREYPALSEGPLSFTEMVKVVSVPAMAVGSAVLVTARSAERLT